MKLELVFKIFKHHDAVGIIRRDGYLSDNEFYEYLVDVEKWNPCYLQKMYDEDSDEFYRLKSKVTAEIKKEISEQDEDNRKTDDGTGLGCHGRYYGQLNRCATCDSWLCREAYKKSHGS